MKRIGNASEANDFLREIENSQPEIRKYIVLDCTAENGKAIIINHVHDIYMGRRNYHFLLTGLVSTFPSKKVFYVSCKLKLLNSYLEENIFDFVGTRR